jgi:4-amino-4-deoxy-L-arabinose transferase-like glycosyltransferase
MTVPAPAPATRAFAISFWRERPFLAFAIFAAVLTALRLAALFVSDANLGPDEAQYWVWSKSLAAGYFSKPPLIAWIIGATTAAFGDAEWAVRLSSPFLHLGSASLLFALARRLYGATVAFWAGAAWITLPGVALAAQLITTDSPLLLFWNAAHYAFFRLCAAPNDARSSLVWGGLLGAAFGLGMLAKYAMIYFVFGAGLAIMLSREIWQAPLARGLAVAAVVGAAIIAPNIVWNARHEFLTLSHTAANASWGDASFQPLKLIEFVAAQAGVIGPILFLLFAWGLATVRVRLAAAGSARGADIALLAFALPPLAIVAAQAFISRAHANWAAVAYPTAILLVAAWACRNRWLAAVQASTALHLAAGIALIAALSNFALIDALGLDNAVKRVRGWEAQGPQIAAAAQGYDAILVDDRELMSALLYYARKGPPVAALNSNRRIDNHYEAFMAFDPSQSPRALFVAAVADTHPIEADFSGIVPRGAITTTIGSSERTLYLYEVSDFRRAR